MVNYEKTEECCKRENYLYDKPPDYIGKQNWRQKVTNPSTGMPFSQDNLEALYKMRPAEEPASVALITIHYLNCSAYCAILQNLIAPKLKASNSNLS
jgi:hypothetical protein